MPYINYDDRLKIDCLIDALIDHLESDDPGAMNYAVTRLLCGACRINKEPRYRSINQAVGVLECVKLEMYRRLSRYEDDKIVENGDVREYSEFHAKMDGNDG
jgi:hypothetical protein